MTYNTKQKDLILDIIKKQKYPFTVKDIYSSVSKEVGLTTIYRLVDSLVNDGFLKKDDIYYQYIDKCDDPNHFYLKCTKCGQIIHVDCELASVLSEHIKEHHNFKLSKDHIIINGICEECQRR